MLLQTKSTEKTSPLTLKGFSLNNLARLLVDGLLIRQPPPVCFTEVLFPVVVDV